MSSSGSTPALRLRPPAVLVEVEGEARKPVGEEVRARKDLTRFARSASVVLGVDGGAGVGGVVDALLARLVADEQLPAAGAAAAKAAVVGASGGVAAGGGIVLGGGDVAGDALLPVVAGEKEDAEGRVWHWKRALQGAGCVVAFGKAAALDPGAGRAVAVARLAVPARLGAVVDGLVRFVVLVLGPAAEVKEAKGSYELARTFSSMFQDEHFYEAARSADDEEGVRSAIEAFVDRDAVAEDGDSGGATARRRRKRRRGKGAGGGGGVGGEGEDDAADELDDGEGAEGARPSNEVFSRSGRFAGGLIDDVKRRYRPSVYLSDWTDGVGDFRSMLKYVSAIVWLYFAIIMPTIAFGALDDDNTEGAIGVIETLVSQGAAGLAFAAFAGQPLTIVMTTAPLTVFIDVLFSWSKSLEIPFLPFYAWTGIWTAAILMILVVTDSCAIMKYCGNFTEEIFAMLIAALFVGEYVKSLIKVADKEPTDVFLLAFILATGTYLIAHSLLVVKRSFLLKPIVRLLLSDFGVPIAIIIMSGVRQLFKDVDAEMLAVPEEIGIVTTSGRPWFVPLFDLNIKFIMLAGVSGILLSTLFFLDQNISSILVNRAENKLRKGPGYYLDLVVVSVIIVVQSLLGMPWTHAALPHSPLHARQLADVEEYEAHGRRYERVTKARETRLTGFLCHVLIFASILLKDALGKIPLAVLYGFFLYMGFATLDGNSMWDRILLLFTQNEKYPANHYVRRVPIKKIHLYTMIQLFLLVVLWFFKSNFYLGDTVFNAGLLFPFIIAAFIPVRLFILPRMFTKYQLASLGHEAEEEVDISDEGITV